MGGSDKSSAAKINFSTNVLIYGINLNCFKMRRQVLRGIGNKKLSVGEVYGFLFAFLYLTVFFYGASRVEVISSVFVASARPCVCIFFSC